VSIEFSGDDLARRVPLLGQFRDDLAGMIDPLADIVACRWADGVPDKDTTTLQARDAVRGVLAKYVTPAYGELGEAVGLQGDKLDLVRRIGDSTEAGNTDLAGGWGEGEGEGEGKR
jgi:hypothetical protein